MKLIKSSVELIEESNPFKKIELVGRTCYKSEPKGEPEKFYAGLVKRGHTAMVEHATFVFQVSESIYEDMIGHKFFNYSQVNGRCLISGNLRAINESREMSLLKVLHQKDPMLVYTRDLTRPLDLFPPIEDIALVDLASLENLNEIEFMAHAYFSFHFICDRGVTHEIVRHRPASYAQESTRYCNYSQEKFGNEITCIEPAGYDEWDDYPKKQLRFALTASEDCYKRMLDWGMTPQQARAVLPNALKTEIIMTASAGEFEHFFNLRSRGTTGAPHPDMKVVADMALALYEDKKNKML